MTANDGDFFFITMARNWRKTMETWFKKRNKKHASAVTNHLPDWICKINGDKVLYSLQDEDQRLAKSMTWEETTLLNQEKVDTKDILDMDVQWLEGCTDMSLNSN